ncbi:hypothetical protein S7711_09858 [Stachybotrys chartarum IBT 7711]|uniref:LysM domain-containing protein n=1 Tax=Stachybotrys chartarum (strain CBS 109288 / IBT 7711) TaxID=1280523 RepID=A0A084AID6_STACB|nr:hypothetical protein S7711_09858 [Stachybotrys chartarum IBT 7711]KFA50338.1 hypothetical protein S40293_09932 [Stachybotrys chartarum IBT 40293]
MLVVVTAISPSNAHGFTTARAPLDTRAVGFQIVPQQLLDTIGLQDRACLSVLRQSINCDSAVADLGQRHEYQGSLDDVELTDAVCESTCQRALTVARPRIAGACVNVPELLPGRTTLSFIDSVISGWNETCLRDENTGEYCNAIIDSWGEYEELEEMPEDELCSYCWGTKLRMMQASEYSAYDELFAETLQHVNQECGVNGPTTPINEPPPYNASQPEESYSGRRYTTAEGDTCDSIAIANSASSATLFYLNAHLPNCTAIRSGLELCLPDQCATTVVRDGDSCVSIAVAAGVLWNKLVDWNAMIDWGCTNIHSTAPFWGRVLCVSEPGGEFEDEGPGEGSETGNGNEGGQGGSGDGYSNTVVEPPAGGTVAEATTTECGFYVQAGDGIGCAQMIVTANRATPMDLFLEANPSLGTAVECNDNLEAGLWYCLSPVYGWDDGQPPRPTQTGSTTLASRL